MGLKLPIYVISGAKPVSWTRTQEGGSRLLGWDFERREMTPKAADWDDLVSDDTFTVTKKEFDAEVARLRKEGR